MVVTTFLVVILRYVFGLGYIWLQEIVTYSHAILFLSAIAYGLSSNSHVRVDLVYRMLSKKNRALMDVVGTVFFLFPVAGLILFHSYPYVMSSWAVYEGSKDSGGLNAVFLLKSFLMIFPCLLILQGIAQIIEALSSD